MKTKRLQKFLLLLVVAIWGMVALRVYSTVASAGAEEQDKNEQPNAAISLKRSAFVYKADTRDPFCFAPSAHRSDFSRNQSATQKELWIPPPLKLTGILYSKTRRKTAVVESTSGSVFFVSEGDTLSGAKILKIGPNAVSYLFQRQKSQWILEAQ